MGECPGEYEAGLSVVDENIDEKVGYIMRQVYGIYNIDLSYGELNAILNVEEKYFAGLRERSGGFLDDPEE